MIRRPPRSTLDRSSAASDVYKRQEYDFGTAPKFYSVQFDEIPAATNSAGLTVSGVADNLDEIKFYLNGKLTKKIRVDSDGKFSTILSNYCLLYTSRSPRDRTRYRMPSSP